MALQNYIDLTNLKATATVEDIEKLCVTADKYGFFSVCVNSAMVATARKALIVSPVKVCAVVGFPLGAMSTQAKVFEAKQATADGADELDMVINVGRLKMRDYKYVEEEINAIARETKLLKVIIETCYLTDEEIITVSQIVARSKASYIKTSTGFGTAGATIENVRLMRKYVGDNKGVKAAGGIRDLESAMLMFRAGANRLGASAMFPELMREDIACDKNIMEVDDLVKESLSKLDCKDILIGK